MHVRLGVLLAAMVGAMVFWTGAAEASRLPATTIPVQTDPNLNQWSGGSTLNDLNDGSVNTVFGRGAMQYINDGSHNTGFGAYALLDITDANQVTGVGQGAAQSSKVDGTTAVGTYALEGTTTGAGNTAVGNEALRYNKTGNQNLSLIHISEPTRPY